MWMILSLRMPGASAPGASLPSCRRLQKQKDDTLKNSIVEYTNPELIEPSKRLNRGVAIAVASALAIASRNAADARPGDQQA